MNAKTSTHPRVFHEARESQDDYCKGCQCLCNVTLANGEICCDRVEKSADGNRYIPTYQAHADASVRLDIEPDAEEEAADFQRQVLECLSHWPGITPVDLDA